MQCNIRFITGPADKIHRQDSTRRDFMGLKDFSNTDPSTPQGPTVCNMLPPADSCSLKKQIHDPSYLY